MAALLTDDNRSIQPHRSGARRIGLFVLAFGSGFAVLTIEIAGARLIAPVFGLFPTSYRQIRRALVPSENAREI